LKGRFHRRSSGKNERIDEPEAQYSARRDPPARMENAVSTPTERPIPGLAAHLRRRFIGLLAGWKHRKGLATLATFDDRALADIGLTRSDLYDALAQQIWNDPTSMLECRRAARRDNRFYSATTVRRPRRVTWPRLKESSVAR
jgi:uncharacterized protein YjiS (DUF1127 family)